MSRKYKVVLGLGLSAVTLLLVTFLLRNSNIAVLNPKGTISAQQHDLIIIATLLMLIVVLPVFVLTGLIAWRYRETNTTAKYSPDLSGNKLVETIWWTVPLIIIAILSIIIWKSSHDLDPFKPIEATKKPMTIQVIALDWKWLFIYPEQNIASVNYVQFPKDTPINFKLTSDGAMNSFWIPQLGGQIYAMAGMETTLHLIANEKGEFSGQSANLSGEGFAGMKFIAKSTSESDFTDWVNNTQSAPLLLDHAEFSKLAEPSKSHAPLYYSSISHDLYDSVINRYLTPTSTHGDEHNGH